MKRIFATVATVGKVLALIAAGTVWVIEVVVLYILLGIARLVLGVIRFLGQP